MNAKGIVKYIVLLVVVAIIYGVVKSQQPKEIDWRTTYDNRHIIPYGTKALFEMLPELFNKEIKVSRSTIYEELKDTYTEKYVPTANNDEATNNNDIFVAEEADEPETVEWGPPDSSGYYSDSAMVKIDSAAATKKDSTEKAKLILTYPPVTNYLYQTQKAPLQNYIFIQDNIYLDESTDEKQLLNFVGRGNTAFIAAESFSQSLLTRLGFTVEYHFTEGSLTDKVFNVLHLVDGPYDGKVYTFDDTESFYYISHIDSAKTKVLGTNKHNDPNLISISYGAGYFVISTCPKVFTNYHVLKNNNSEYAAAALSYLPQNRAVLWDQYFKEGRRRGKSENPMRVLLENESARVAIYLLAIFFVLYIVFFGKRTQRIIPLLTPFTNSTVEFTQTVGRLYYQKRDHKNLALKKYYYLLDFVRQHYFMGSNLINRDWSDTLAAKTAYNPNKLWMIFSAAETIKMRDNITEEELIVFNNHIEDFYTHLKNSTTHKPVIL